MICRWYLRFHPLCSPLQPSRKQFRENWHSSPQEGSLVFSVPVLLSICSWGPGCCCTTTPPFLGLKFVVLRAAVSIQSGLFLFHDSLQWLSRVRWPLRNRASCADRSLLVGTFKLVQLSHWILWMNVVQLRQLGRLRSALCNQYKSPVTIAHWKAPAGSPPTWCTPFASSRLCSCWMETGIGLDCHGTSGEPSTCSFPFDDSTEWPSRA